MSKTGRKPKTSSPAQGFQVGKTPRTRPLDETHFQKSLPIFSFKHLDRIDREDWSWPEGSELKEIFDFLCEISKLTWDEVATQSTGTGIRRRKHHHHPLETLPNKTQNIITDLKLDEIFEGALYRFRLGGQKRLWGFRKSEIFYILWWDPNHMVYPTEVD